MPLLTKTLNTQNSTQLFDFRSRNYHFSTLFPVFPWETTTFFRVFPCLNPVWPNAIKKANIDVMIEEHIYHFLNGLSFSFFLPILLLLSGYWHQLGGKSKIVFCISHCCCNFTTSGWQKLIPTHWRLPQWTGTPGDWYPRGLVPSII